jgi:hypothetical protein
MQGVGTVFSDVHLITSCPFYQGKNYKFFVNIVDKLEKRWYNGRQKDNMKQKDFQEETKWPTMRIKNSGMRNGAYFYIIWRINI